MPNFSWSAFLEEAGLKNLEKLGVLMLDYTKALDNIISSADLNTWKIYLKWGVLNASASRLNEAIDKEDFYFYSKELRGIPEQPPMWRRGVSTVNGIVRNIPEFYSAFNITESNSLYLDPDKRVKIW